MMDSAPPLARKELPRQSVSKGLLAQVADAWRMLWTHRRILLSTTHAEIRKKYAATYLGVLWTVLYPVCFLAMYSFLYLVVFQLRLPEFSQFGYVLFVFTGIVPYLAFADVASTSAVAVKQNIHLVKNVMMPLDIIPVRIVLTALVGEVIGLALLMLLLLLSGELSWSFPAIVIALAIQFLFLLGLAWLLAALGVLLPDLSNFVGLVILFLMFVSPIAYKPEMVPEGLQWVVTLNPLSYLIDITRSSLVAGYPFSASRWLIAAALALVTLLAGLMFFRRFKMFIIDYE